MSSPEKGLPSTPSQSFHTHPPLPFHPFLMSIRHLQQAGFPPDCLGSSTGDLNSLRQVALAGRAGGILRGQRRGCPPRPAPQARGRYQTVHFLWAHWRSAAGTAPHSPLPPPTPRQRRRRWGRPSEASISVPPPPPTCRPAPAPRARCPC